MEEDDAEDLVIDLDNEKAEVPDSQTHINVAMCPIKCNHYNPDTIKFVEKPSTKELQETSIRHSTDTERNSNDDYIHVIDDDDDDSEHSVQKIINTANKIAMENLNNKQWHGAKGYRIHKRDNQEYGTSIFNVSNVNQIRNTYKKVVPGKNQVEMDIRRNRAMRCVKDNRHSEINNIEPSYGFQYAADHIPHLVYEGRLSRTDSYLPNVLPISYRLESVPPVYIQNDSIRPEVPLCVGNLYYPIMNSYDHVHRPEIPQRHNFYTHDLLNRTCIHQIQRPGLSKNGCNNREMTRDTNNYNCRPEVLGADECSRYEINKAAHFYTYQPEDPIRLDDRQIAIDRDAYRYAYRPSETLLNNNYRHAVTNRLAYNHCIPGHNIDDYWQAKMSRVGCRPEDYERTIRNSDVDRNTYEPLVALRDAYRSEELSNSYSPHLLVNTEAYRKHMLMRNAYYPETTDLHSYRPRITPISRNKIANTYSNENSSLDLSRKQETINVTAIKSRGEITDVKKQRNILYTGNQISKVSLNMHKVKQASLDIDISEKEQSHRNLGNPAAKNNNTTLRVNKSDEAHIEVCDPGVQVTTTRPGTVILSTGNIYQKNTPAQSYVIASSKSTEDRCLNIQAHTAEERENHGAIMGNYIDQNANKVNTSHGRKEVNDQKKFMENKGAEKDNKIRFLVVFFSRVKELMKETFPEFSKSLEKEIVNLEEWTNSGRMKTDIQYICPLYCSVSIYSLPRFDNTDDDNKIEKYANCPKICDVCSCIQKCYKLYKKKYCDLISTNTYDKPETICEKRHDRISGNSPIDSEGAYRRQTVICKRKGTVCENIVMSQYRSKNDIEVNEDLQGDPVRSIIDNTTRDKDMQGAYKNIFIDKHRTTSLNEERLMDSLSVLNFNLPSKNPEHAMVPPNYIPTISISNSKGIFLLNSIDNSREEINKTDERRIINDKEETDNKIKFNQENVSRDESEATVVFSSSLNDINTKLKDKIRQKPDTAYTCHICTCTFTYFSSFVSHMQNEHNLNEFDENIPDECISRKCRFCGIYSKQKLHNDHVERAHPEIFTYKEEPTEIQLIKDNKKRKSMKRKFIFKCLVCHKNLISTEVKKHREKEHKGLKIAKMFTKKLSTMN